MQTKFLPLLSPITTFLFVATTFVLELWPKVYTYLAPLCNSAHQNADEISNGVLEDDVYANDQQTESSDLRENFCLILNKHRHPRN